MEEISQAPYWLSEEVSYSLTVVIHYRYFKVLANGSYLAYYTEMPHTTPVSSREHKTIDLEK